MPIEEIVSRYHGARANSIEALAKEIGVTRQHLHRMVKQYEDAQTSQAESGSVVQRAEEGAA